MCNYLTRGMKLALVLIATKCCGLQKVYIDFKRWNMLMAGRAIVCWTTMVWMLRLKPLTIRRMYTFCKNLLLATDTYRASAWPRRAVFILTELFCFSFSEVSVREQWLQAQSGPLGFCLFSPCFFLAFIQRRTSHHNCPQPIQDEFNSKYSAPKTHPCHFHQRRHASSDRLAFHWKHQKPDRCFPCQVCQPIPGSTWVGTNPALLGTGRALDLLAAWVIKILKRENQTKIKK